MLFNVDVLPRIKNYEVAGTELRKDKQMNLK